MAAAMAAASMKVATAVRLQLLLLNSVGFEQGGPFLNGVGFELTVLTVAMQKTQVMLRSTLTRGRIWKRLGFPGPGKMGRSKQSIDRSINRSKMNQSINEPIDRSIDQSITQSFNQSIDRSIE